MQWLRPSWAKPSLFSVSSTLESVFKNVGFIVLAPVSVDVTVDVHCPGAGKAKEGKCQKLKPSFEDYDLCEVRFAVSVPQVWLLERQLGSSIVCFFSAVAQVAAAAAANLDWLEPFCVFFLVYLTIVDMSEMLPLLLGVLASSISVFVVTADWASAAWFAFVGHLAQMTAAATCLARAAAHKFVPSVSCSILAKVQHVCLATVLHGHVLGLWRLVMRYAFFCGDAAAGALQYIFTLEERLSVQWILSISMQSMGRLGTTPTSLTEGIGDQASGRVDVPGGELAACSRFARATWALWET